MAIIDAADYLNPAAANALLKALEEPPPRSVFLIVAHQPGRVLPTIRSRCRRLLLPPLAANDVRAVLASLGPPWDAADAPTLTDAVARSDGSVRRAIELLDREKIAILGEVDGF